MILTYRFGLGKQGRKKMKKWMMIALPVLELLGLSVIVAAGMTFTGMLSPYASWFFRLGVVRSGMWFVFLALGVWQLLTALHTDTEQRGQLGFWLTMTMCSLLNTCGWAFFGVGLHLGA